MKRKRRENEAWRTIRKREKGREHSSIMIAMSSEGKKRIIIIVRQKPEIIQSLFWSWRENNNNDNSISTSEASTLSHETHTHTHTHPMQFIDLQTEKETNWQKMTCSELCNTHTHIYITRYIENQLLIPRSTLTFISQATLLYYC